MEYRKETNTEKSNFSDISSHILKERIKQKKLFKAVRIRNNGAEEEVGREGGRKIRIFKDPITENEMNYEFDYIKAKEVKIIKISQEIIRKLEESKHTESNFNKNEQIRNHRIGFKFNYFPSLENIKEKGKIIKKKKLITKCPHKFRNHHAKGMCRSCYQRDYFLDTCEIKKSGLENKVGNILKLNTINPVKSCSNESFAKYRSFVKPFTKSFINLNTYSCNTTKLCQMEKKNEEKETKELENKLDKVEKVDNIEDDSKPIKRMFFNIENRRKLEENIKTNNILRHMTCPKPSSIEANESNIATEVKESNETN